MKKLLLLGFALLGICACNNSMKTAIVIQNDDCTIKSAAVVAIYHELLRLGAVLQEEPIGDPFMVAYGEVKAIVEYKGQKIGIQSEGDPRELDFAVCALESFVEQNCTVIISTSCRQNTPTAATQTQIIDLLRGAGYQTIETSQYHLAHNSDVLPNGVDVNKQYARAIADLVDQVLSKTEKHNVLVFCELYFSTKKSCRKSDFF